MHIQINHGFGTTIRRDRSKVRFFLIAAQTAANVIRTVVDQGMQHAEVMIKGPGKNLHFEF